MGICTRDGARNCKCDGCKDARKIIILRSDLARVTAERDALRAEVEAMRGVVEAAEPLSHWRGVTYDDDEEIGALLNALDALRARKVGG